MDEATARRLNAINRDFYETTADEFHITRATPWRGWERLLTHVRGSLSVLDIGCGNGRFGVFLAEHGRLPLTYHGIDSSPKLLAFAQHSLTAIPGVTAKLEQRDIVDALLADAASPFEGARADLVVLFGVMHHIPGAAQRARLMRWLGACVKPGGILAFACWRFLELPRFRERIIPWDDETHIETGDHLLDWRRGMTAIRYCHFVDDDEHAALIRASGLREIDTYRADGESGDANRYSVLLA